MSQPEQTWGTALAEGIATLSGTSPTPKLDASVLLAHLLDVPRTALFAYPERGLPPEHGTAYRALLARRATGEPVAYLVGVKEFMGMRLMVDRRVLVPRPETELVVEAALGAITARIGLPPDEDDDAPPTPVPDLLAADVGTGSGAIAIALAALEPRLGRIYATDISEDALAVARHNGD
nr:50S ribosomal protein L11 methyltransferase [Ktedonobacterales bacterium]